MFPCMTCGNKTMNRKAVINTLTQRNTWITLCRACYEREWLQNAIHKDPDDSRVRDLQTN